MFTPVILNFFVYRIIKNGTKILYQKIFFKLFAKNYQGLQLQTKGSIWFK